ncbi:uncharacterized protein LOC143274752 [Babylonia areolata]|uniref:uncharacterized protein LOC143274752 n=1 Tax=Babylonia areolata TaxID=304850 RepID=UPI003FD0016B
MKPRAWRFLLVTASVLAVLTVYFELIPPFLPSPEKRGGKRPSSLQEAGSRMSVAASETRASGWSAEKNSEVMMSTKAEASRPSRGKVIVDNTSVLLEVATEMHRQHGVVLFTMINDAFLDFAASWCCNTASFDHVHRHVLFLTTDLRTGQRLQSLWPEVTVAVVSSPQFLGAMAYSRASYVRLMVERTRFLLRLLESGVQLLLFEVDSVWLRNPLPLVLARQSEGDIVATRVSDRNKTAGGFLLLNPTPATVRFWQELTRMMDKLYDKIKKLKAQAAVSEGENDQEFFTTLVKKKFAGVKIVHLPAETFPDGKWYRLPEKKRQESRPVLINNNWISGIKAKRQRAKNFGHWFWDESEGRCNSSALRRSGL